MIADLGGLGSIATRAPWSEVEQVIEARFEWERLPLEPLEGGGVHVGALDAMAGLPFRVVAIPGLVEGGYPGVFRPDPFLLDSEREALRHPEGGSASAPDGSFVVRSSRSGPLARSSQALPARPLLGVRFSRPACPLRAAPRRSPLPRRSPHHPPPASLPTTQDRLVEARRLFHRAVSQATERLILSYPRVDARSGRERLPSLFFAAAAATLAGRPVAGAELDRMVSEDDPLRLPLEDAVDAGERDRFRVRRDDAAATAIAAGSPFFQQSRLASQARWSGRLTRYDGLVLDEAGELGPQLDPLLARHPVSASRLAIYARCGFQYLLQNVLRLSPAPEPEERRRIDPLERGDLFHRVAEAFLRERRDRGELPVTRRRGAARAAARDGGGGAAGPGGGQPAALHAAVGAREAALPRDDAGLAHDASRPPPRERRPRTSSSASGSGWRPTPREPHDPEPLEIDLGDGRSLRVSGRIDRIDRRARGRSRVARLQDRARAEGRRRALPRRPAAADPVLRAGGGEAVPRRGGGGRLPRLRRRRTPGGLPPRARDGPGLPRAAARPHGPRGPRECSCRSRAPATSATSRWCADPRACCSAARAYKLRDPSLQAYLRLRDIG